MVKILAAITVLALAGCTAVPVLTPAGEPVLDPQTGEPETELVVDDEAVEAAVVAGAAVLPPPFNLLLPGLAGLITLATTKGKK